MSEEARSEGVDPELLGLFLEELDEGIHQLNVTLLGLQGAPRPDACAALWSACLRTTHSLKGAAQATRAHAIADALHLLEDLCAHEKLQGPALDHASGRALLQLVDAVTVAADRLGRGDPSGLEALTRYVEARRASTRGIGLSTSPRSDPPGEDLSEQPEAIDELTPWELDLIRLEEAVRLWRVAREHAGHGLVGSSLDRARRPLQAVAAHLSPLLSAIRASRRALGSRPTSAPEIEGAPPSDRRRLLVVDDSATMRVAQRRLFERAGYQVEAATNGIEAWRMLAESSFDAVVSDVIMPELDGIGLTERIRGSKTYGALPVVLVSSMSCEDCQDRALDAGAAAYVIKTAEGRAQMIAKIAELLGGST